MLPLWYAPQRRIAYWDRFAMPSQPVPHDLGWDYWWYDVNRAARLAPTPSPCLGHSAERDTTGIK
ncbi:Uncharacterised protein [Edwardsiella tarda]|nr:Uncharacterised protein [Edwardsiella tarda]